MATEHTYPPPRWTREDSRQMRQLAKHLRRVNEVAGVFDPSGGVVEGEKRLQYLQLAKKLAASMGADSAPWANAVAWADATSKDTPCKTQ